MFSVRLVSADSYQAQPLPQLDPAFSEFRGSEIKHVPIVRVFGSLQTGEKTCLHIHGVFPYLYVPYTGEEDPASLAYRLAASLDAAINVSLGSATSATQHVYLIQRVSGIPFYGYHKKEHQYLKIYFYNPAMIKRAADLLQNGSVLNRSLQPHEAHIPYVLQFMMDYNVYGMSMINLKGVKHRRITQSLAELGCSGHSGISENSEIDYLPSSVERQSTCELEMDALASDILNRREIERGLDLNPGLAAIWEEERARRAQAGLQGGDSQLVNPKSPPRPTFQPTDNDLYQEQRLARRLLMISQCDESTLSTPLSRSVAYAAEVRDGENLMNSSNISIPSVQRSQLVPRDNTVEDVSLHDSPTIVDSPKLSADCSVLGTDDQPLVDILVELAGGGASENPESVDMDSVLGSQVSLVASEPRSDNEDEDEDIPDLNLTSLQLDSLSDTANVRNPREDSSREKSSSSTFHLSPFPTSREAVSGSSRSADDEDGERITRDSSTHRMPQYDGAGDVSPTLVNSSSSSDDEKDADNPKNAKEFSHLPKYNGTCEVATQSRKSETREQTTKSSCRPSNALLPNSQWDSPAYESDRIADHPRNALDRSLVDGTLETDASRLSTSPSSALTTDAYLGQYTAINYEPFDRLLEIGPDFVPDLEGMHSSMEIGILLSSGDSDSPESVIQESDKDTIPLDAVLNGDPCFTESAELDKSDVTELRDQYASLLGNSLLPDVHTNPHIDDDLGSASNFSDSDYQANEKSCNFSLNAPSPRSAAASRDSSSSSENVTPNIQEPEVRGGAKIKLSPSNAHEDCKEPRGPSDNSDYNCNFVATWAELQNIRQDKRLYRLRNRRNGQWIPGPRQSRRKADRRSLPNIATQLFGRVPENMQFQLAAENHHRSSRKIPLSSAGKTPVKKAKNVTPAPYIPAENAIATIKIVEAVEEKLSTSPLPGVARLPKLEREETSEESACQPLHTEASLAAFHRSIIGSDNPLAESKKSPENLSSPEPFAESLVEPALPVFEELSEDLTIELPDRETEILRGTSHYSSSRSARSFGGFEHRHCTWAVTQRRIIQDQVFTSDQIYVIEKRKRGKQLPPDRSLCTRCCKLPFVPLRKLDLGTEAKIADRLEARIKTEESSSDLPYRPSSKPAKSLGAQSKISSVNSNQKIVEAILADRLPKRKSRGRRRRAEIEPNLNDTSSMTTLSSTDGEPMSFEWSDWAENEGRRSVRRITGDDETRDPYNMRTTKKPPSSTRLKNSRAGDSEIGTPRACRDLPGIPGIIDYPKKRGRQKQHRVVETRVQAPKPKPLRSVLFPNWGAEREISESPNGAAKTIQNGLVENRRASLTERRKGRSLKTALSISPSPKSQARLEDQSRPSDRKILTNVKQMPENEALNSMIREVKCPSTRAKLKMLIKSRRRSKLGSLRSERKLSVTGEERASETKGATPVVPNNSSRSAIPRISVTTASTREEVEEYDRISLEKIVADPEKKRRPANAPEEPKIDENCGSREAPTDEFDEARAEDRVDTLDFETPALSVVLDAPGDIFDTETEIVQGVSKSRNCEESPNEPRQLSFRSDKYAISVANFFTASNYTIDAVSLEIPTCLFEEDSNSVEQRLRIVQEGSQSSLDAASSLDPRDLDVYDAESLTPSSSFSQLADATESSLDSSELSVSSVLEESTKSEFSVSESRYSRSGKTREGQATDSKDTDDDLPEEDSPEFEALSPSPKICEILGNSLEEQFEADQSSMAEQIGEESSEGELARDESRRQESAERADDARLDEEIEDLVSHIVVRLEDEPELAADCKARRFASGETVRILPGTKSGAEVCNSFFEEKEIGSSRRGNDREDSAGTKQGATVERDFSKGASSDEREQDGRKGVVETRIEEEELSINVSKEKVILSDEREKKESRMNENDENIFPMRVNEVELVSIGEEDEAGIADSDEKKAAEPLTISKSESEVPLVSEKDEAVDAAIESEKKLRIESRSITSSKIVDLIVAGKEVLDDEETETADREKKQLIVAQKNVELLIARSESELLMNEKFESVDAAIESETKSVDADESSQPSIATVETSEPVAFEDDANSPSITASENYENIFVRTSNEVELAKIGDKQLATIEREEKEPIVAQKNSELLITQSETEQAFINEKDERFDAEIEREDKLIESRERSIATTWEKARPVTSEDDSPSTAVREAPELIFGNVGKFITIASSKAASSVAEEEPEESHRISIDAIIEPTIETEKGASEAPKESEEFQSNDESAGISRSKGLDAEIGKVSQVDGNMNDAETEQRESSLSEEAPRIETRKEAFKCRPVTIKLISLDLSTFPSFALRSRSKSRLGEAEVAAALELSNERAAALVNIPEEDAERKIGRSARTRKRAGRSQPTRKWAGKIKLEPKLSEEKIRREFPSENFRERISEHSGEQSSDGSEENSLESSSRDVEEKYCRTKTGKAESETLSTSRTQKKIGENSALNGDENGDPEEAVETVGGIETSMTSENGGDDTTTEDEVSEKNSDINFENSSGESNSLRDDFGGEITDRRSDESFPGKTACERDVSYARRVEAKRKINSRFAKKLRGCGRRAIKSPTKKIARRVSETCREFVSTNRENSAESAVDQSSSPQSATDENANAGTIGRSARNREMESTKAGQKTEEKNTALISSKSRGMERFGKHSEEDAHILDAESEKFRKKCAGDSDEKMSGKKCAEEVDENISGKKCAEEVDEKMYGKKCAEEINEKMCTRIRGDKISKEAQKLLREESVEDIAGNAEESVVRNTVGRVRSGKKSAEENVEFIAESNASQERKNIANENIEPKTPRDRVGKNTSEEINIKTEEANSRESDLSSLQSENDIEPISVKPRRRGRSGNSSKANRQDSKEESQSQDEESSGVEKISRNSSLETLVDEPIEKKNPIKPEKKRHVRKTPLTNVGLRFPENPALKENNSEPVADEISQFKRSSEQILVEESVEETSSKPRKRGRPRMSQMENARNLFPECPSSQEEDELIEPTSPAKVTKMRHPRMKRMSAVDDPTPKYSSSQEENIMNSLGARIVAKLRGRGRGRSSMNVRKGSLGTSSSRNGGWPADEENSLETSELPARKNVVEVLGRKISEKPGGRVRKNTPSSQEEIYWNNIESISRESEESSREAIEERIDSKSPAKLKRKGRTCKSSSVDVKTRSPENPESREESDRERAEIPYREPKVIDEDSEAKSPVELKKRGRPRKSLAVGAKTPLPDSPSSQESDRVTTENSFDEPEVVPQKIIDAETEPKSFVELKKKGRSRKSSAVDIKRSSPKTASSQEESDRETTENASEEPEMRPQKIINAETEPKSFVELKKKGRPRKSLAADIKTSSPETASSQEESDRETTENASEEPEMRPQKIIDEETEPKSFVELKKKGRSRKSSAVDIKRSSPKTASSQEESDRETTENASEEPEMRPQKIIDEETEPKSFVELKKKGRSRKSSAVDIKRSSPKTASSQEESDRETTENASEEPEMRPQKIINEETEPKSFIELKKKGRSRKSSAVDIKRSSPKTASSQEESDRETTENASEEPEMRPQKIIDEETEPKSFVELKRRGRPRKSLAADIKTSSPETASSQEESDRETTENSSDEPEVPPQNITDEETEPKSPVKLKKKGRGRKISAARKTLSLNVPSEQEEGHGDGPENASQDLDVSPSESSPSIITMDKKMETKNSIKVENKNRVRKSHEANSRESSPTDLQSPEESRHETPVAKSPKNPASLPKFPKDKIPTKTSTTTKKRAHVCSLEVDDDFSSESVTENTAPEVVNPPLESSPLRPQNSSEKSSAKNTSPGFAELSQKDTKLIIDGKILLKPKKRVRFDEASIRRTASLRPSDSPQETAVEEPSSKNHHRLSPNSKLTEANFPGEDERSNNLLNTYWNSSETIEFCSSAPKDQTVNASNPSERKLVDGANGLRENKKFKFNFSDNVSPYLSSLQKIPRKLELVKIPKSRETTHRDAKISPTAPMETSDAPTENPRDIDEGRSSRWSRECVRLRRPMVVLKRLSRDSLRSHGYAFRSKGKKFVKNLKKSGVEDFRLPAYDGAADLTSSDSEDEADLTIASDEKRVCIYQSGKKSAAPRRETIATPKKRRLDEADDDSAGPSSKRRATPKKSSHRSPSRTSMLKSPGRLSGYYSPLNIIVTSPKVRKQTSESRETHCPESRDANASSSGSVTPGRKRDRLHESMMRGRISATKSSTMELGERHEFPATMVSERSGELDGIASVRHEERGNVDTTISNEPAEATRIRDATAIARDTRDVRKRLVFLSTGDKSGGLKSDEPNEESREFNVSRERGREFATIDEAEEPIELQDNLADGRSTMSVAERGLSGWASKLDDRDPYDVTTDEESAEDDGTFDVRLSQYADDRAKENRASVDRSEVDTDSNDVRLDFDLASSRSVVKTMESRHTPKHCDKEPVELADDVADTESRISIVEPGFPLPSTSASKSGDRDSYDVANDEEEFDVTFSQYVDSRMSENRALLDRSRIDSESNDERVVMRPKFDPPSRQSIVETMETHGIPRHRNQEPFFSIDADVPKQKELAHRTLKVPGKSLKDVPAFVSSVDGVTGIARWRKMKITEFIPSLTRSNDVEVKIALCSNDKVVLTPLARPPTRKEAKDWLRAREYLKKKKREEDESRRKILAEKEKIDTRAAETEDDCSSNASDLSAVEPSPESTGEKSEQERALSRGLKVRLAKRGLLRKVEEATGRKTRHGSEEEVEVDSQRAGGSRKGSGDSNSTEIDPSLLSVLGKSRLFREQEASRHLGVSCGQIEFLSDSTRSNVDNENLQNAKALTRYQYLTIMCLEVHVTTRGDLLPDAQYDPIGAIFYSVQSDVPPTSTIKPLEHGVIVVAETDKAKNKMYYSYASKFPWSISFAQNEEVLLNSLVNLITRVDPEILIGWELETLSWGYVFQRASILGMNLYKRISRIPATQGKWEAQPRDIETLAEVKLPGRIVLDIWRIMRHEAALLSYTFESMMHHVLNERISCPSFKTLTEWWNMERPRPSRWRVVEHYSLRVLGVFRILDQLDIIGRTSELARLFGIQFFEVFSRGSQYRVESVMLRLAKPLNYIAVSPSAQQRASMRAMEALPLIMEPESMFYSDPLIVLDFQSLYPSIIIAHNYCFSTCLGRIEHIGQPEPFEFGAYTLRVPKSTSLKLQGKVNFAPCGVAFVKPEVCRGVLPRMLTEILETRFMVKKAMKDHKRDDKTLQRALHSRQMGLKFLANVTYGYTAANFSGRMPCIEVGDSVVSKSKETLERAIKLVETTPKWGARVVYGDTDSLFILVPGKSKADAFVIGNEIADAVTAANPPPIKLKFEKVVYPGILQTKKRYCGYMYETPEQENPTYLAKGIETVRRDGCPAVSKILEKTLKILFETKDVSLVKKYVTRQLDKVLRGKVSIQDLTFAKEFRGLKGYKAKACVPALELTKRLMKKDPRAVPRNSERVRYVIVAGAPNQALIHCVRTPWELINDPGLRPNGIYYVTRVIIPPLNRCLHLMGVDVNAWYREMPHRHILDNPVGQPVDRQKLTIFQYFGTIVCAVCGQSSNKGICTECVANPPDALVVLHDKLRRLNRTDSHVTAICQSCVGQADVADCASLDCPVLYRRAQAQRELTQVTHLRTIIECGNKLEL